MVCCCVPLCKSEYKNKKDGGLSFHEFPVTHLRDQWIRVISRKGPDNALWQPNGRSKVCSLHFRDDDYRECNLRRLLKPTAVPSIFPGYPWYEESLKKAAKRAGGSADSEMEQDCDTNQNQGPPKPVRTYIRGPGKRKVLLLEAPKKPVATIATTRVVTAPSSQARRAEEAMRTPSANSSSASSSGVLMHPVQVAPHTFFVLSDEATSAATAAKMAAGSKLTIAEPLESETAILETVACETVVTSDDASEPIDEPHMLILPDLAPFPEKPAVLSRSVGQQTSMTSLVLAGVFSEIVNLRTKCSDSKDQLGALSKENGDLKRKCDELQRSLEALAEENDNLKKRLCARNAEQGDGQAP